MNDVTMSPSIAELAKALAKAQSVMKHAAKTKTNPFHKNKYADLTDVWDVLRKPLSDNGLSIVQLPATDQGYLVLTTMLLHTSGEWISSVFRLKSKAETAQEIGGALTYARRYALAAITGNSSDDDDDGNYATGVTQAKESRKPVETSFYSGKDERQNDVLRSLFDHYKVPADKRKELAVRLLNTRMEHLERNVEDLASAL